MICLRSFVMRRVERGAQSFLLVRQHRTGRLPARDVAGQLVHVVEDVTRADAAQRIDLRGRRCPPPTKPSTVMPAAAAAVMPVTLSSTTRHRAGATPSVRAAARYTSGAGFGRATASAQNSRSPKKRARPVRVSAASTYAR